MRHRKGYEQPDTPTDILDLSDPATVERLAAVLEAEGFVRGVARRYGTFNAPYWEQSAAAIIAALREPLP